MIQTRRTRRTRPFPRLNVAHFQPLEPRILLTTALLPLTDHRALFFDPVRHILDISGSNGLLYRYNPATGQMLTAITVGGSLGHGDITPDGNTLLLTDTAAPVIHKIDLATATVTNLPYTPSDPAETTASDLVCLSNISVVFAANESGSGNIFPLHTLDLSTNTFGAAPAPLDHFSAGDALFRSADRQTLLVSELSAGGDPLTLYDVGTNTVTGQGHISFGAWRLDIAAVSRDGALGATTDRYANLTTVSNRQFTPVATLPGGAPYFNPLNNTLYILTAGSSALKSYNASTFALTGTFNVGEAYNYFGSNSGTGEMVASDDGRVLFVATNFGIRLFRIDNDPPPVPVLSTFTPSVAFGRPVVLSAQLPSGTDYTYGSVQFSTGGTVLGLAPVAPGNTAQLALVSPVSFPVGAHSVVAKFFNQASVGGAASDPVTVNVTRVPVKATVFLTQVGLPSRPPAFSISISDDASGTVDLFDGATLLASATVTHGVATIHLSAPLSIGTHTVTATYNGDSSHAPATSSALQFPIEPIFTTIVPTAPTQTTSADSPKFTATVFASDQSAAPGTVSFYDNGTFLDRAPLDHTGRATLQSPPLSAGTHQIIAAYDGALDYAASTSGAIPLRLIVTQRTIIDLLVVYTADTLSEAASFAALRSNVKREIDDTNTAFTSSNIPAQLRLASLSFVNYTQADSMVTDLARLKSSGDGFLDEVQSLRDAVGADLVVLDDAHYTQESADDNLVTEGIASTLLNPNDSARDQTAYLVIAQQAPFNDYVLAHEVGHTLGATHAVGDPTDTGATPYAHGYRFTGTNGVQYHDVMAYDPGQTIPYFSNPNILYRTEVANLGVPLGDAKTADAAREISEQAPAVSNYRATHIIGGIDTASTTAFSGWFLSTQVFETALHLRVDIDGVMRDTLLAAAIRPDLNPAFGTANHGFTYTLPRLPPGPHTVTFYARQDDLSGPWVQLASRTINTPSPIFDETYYLQHNPDVAAAVAAGAFASGYDHFIQAGQFEHRDASLYFDTQYYLDHNPDLAAAFAAGHLPSPFAHYLASGQYEMRLASPYFSERFYRLANPDVAAAINAGQLKNGLEHFILYGQYEGRTPIAYFDPAYFKASFPVATSTAPSLFALFQSFPFVGSNPSPYFDQTVYLALNPDIGVALSNNHPNPPFITALDHYLRYGRDQGRPFSTLFSESSYLAHNPDVQAAITQGIFTCGFEHYLLAGRAENRML